jgi:hypothetical protein
MELGLRLRLTRQPVQKMFACYLVHFEIGSRTIPDAAVSLPCSLPDFIGDVIEAVVMLPCSLWDCIDEIRDAVIVDAFSTADSLEVDAH